MAWIRATPALIDTLTRTVVGTTASLLDQLPTCQLLAFDKEIRLERVAWLRQSLTHASAILSAHLPDFSWRPPAGGVSPWAEWVNEPGRGHVAGPASDRGTSQIGGFSRAVRLMAWGGGWRC